MKEKFTFKFPVKSSEKEFEIFIDSFFKLFNDKRDFAFYEFDLSAVEWMSNQEMLVLTAIFKNLVESKISFKTYFLKNGSTEEIDRRVANQIFQIWNVWKIYQIAPGNDFQNYFDIHGNIVEALQRRFNLKSINGEIYDRYGITPFILFDKIENFDDRIISEMLVDTYKLGSATDAILQANNCSMPFENHTLSSIITKELYENFLDHVNESKIFPGSNSAFMSLSLVPKIRDRKGNEIQRILSKNFTEESAPEFRSFFYDESEKKFTNKSVLHFSFLDFGLGIVSTLKQEFLNRQTASNKEALNISDSDVLKFAFQYDSSKDPIETRYLDKTVIPRGLFDLLNIVKRFNGLLVVRSNYGKIYYDFSLPGSGNSEAKMFGDQSKYFPGTLVSIYIPERNNLEKFDESQIVWLEPSKFKINERIKSNFVNLYSLLSDIKKEKEDKKLIYTNLFDSIVKQIAKDNANSTIHYFDFNGFEIDERVTKKIIHFLVSDYNVNFRNNIVVLNPPPLEFLEILNQEIFELNANVQKYRLHPIPFISSNSKTGSIDIFWMGVYNKADVSKLNDLLLDQNDLRRSDFINPESVTGNINFYDKFGNLHSYINKETIVNYFRNKKLESSRNLVSEIISKYIIKLEGKYFLCPGNYYQEEFLQLYDAINNLDECEILAKALFEQISFQTEIDENYKLICVTASSHQIVRHFDSSIIRAANIVYLDNYHSVIHESTLADSVKKDDKVILICDLFSTGFLTSIIYDRLVEIGASLEKIAVLVDAYDENFDVESTANVLRDKVISVLRMKMKKYRRKDISQKLINNEIDVIRINPYTNTPILEDLSSNFLRDRVLLTNQEFIDHIDESHVKAGYFRFNNLIHPYFFDMNEILGNPEIANNLLNSLFDKLKSRFFFPLEVIFYPKGSAIENLNFDLLKSQILKDHSVQIAKLERFNTNEGWRFPHPPKFMNDLARGKSVLIFDDGSCSGDSIMQMIDEIVALEVKQVIVLSIIGRLIDHKMNFFTQLNSIRGRSGNIPVYVYFGVHWHIPTYYIEESPIIREKSWLESVKSLPNVPRRIRITAENIQNELSLKDINDPSNRYLLKRKDDVSIIKELILVKEEIGKVTSYRYYKDYFRFFDDFIKQYESSDTTIDRYKMVESICAVFLHEPNMYNKVKTILPDLTEKIDIFIQTILFGNPERDYKKLQKNLLFYKWSNKNIIHLFFIVYSGEALFEKLTASNTITILRDFANSESDLYYFFYRILKYLPLNEPDINKKPFSGKVRLLVEVLKENKELSPDVKRQLKRFSNFISSLPSKHEDFFVALSDLKVSYGRIGDDAFHNEYIYNDKLIVVTQLILLVKYIKDDDVKTEDVIEIIQSKWENISVFLSKLLSFYKSYPDFFFDHNYFNDTATGKKSLAKLIGILDEAIYSRNFEEIPTLIDTINEIFRDFVLEDSTPYKIFSTIHIEDIVTEFNIFIGDIINDFPKLNIKYSPNGLLPPVNLPLIYLKEILFKELKSNFRYAREGYDVSFQWTEDSKYVTLTVENEIKIINPNGGGGQGLNKLNKFNQFPVSTSYHSRSDGTKFIQTIRLSKI